MRMKLILKFSDEEQEELNKFQQIVNSQGTVLSMEQLCRQAIFYAINDSYRRAQEMEALNKQKALDELANGVLNGNTTDGVTEGNTGEAPTSEVIDSAVGTQQEVTGATDSIGSES